METFVAAEDLHLDMTGAPLPPEGEPVISEDDDTATPSTTATASQLATSNEPQGAVETIVEADGNLTPVHEEI